MTLTCSCKFIGSTGASSFYNNGMEGEVFQNPVSVCVAN